MEVSNPVQLAKGWAGTTTLDWSKPLSEDVLTLAKEVELVVACDCVWLRSMLDSLLATVESIFASTTCSSPTLLLSFQRRDNQTGTDTGMFTTVRGVIDAIEARRWRMECLAWRNVAMDGVETDKEVFVLAVRIREPGGV